MFRTVFALGICAILGVVALKLVFGVATGLLATAIGLFLWIVSLAIRVALAGLVIYLVLLVLNPALARRMRQRWNDAF